MGFSKEQVIAYIDNLVDKQKAALEEEKEKYTQLQEENEKLVNERDNALAVAREELQGEIDALNGEKDELMLQLEELKNENASLTASNEKLVKDKNELFESIKSIKSQLNDYIVKEKAEKEKLEELENENKILAIALQKAKNASNIDVSAYQAEIEQLDKETAQHGKIGDLENGPADHHKQHGVNMGQHGHLVQLFQQPQLFDHQ